MYSLPVSSWLAKVKLSTDFFSRIRNLRTEQYDFTTSARLANMMGIIAEEIKACGSDLSYYQDKKLICKSYIRLDGIIN